MGTACSVTTMMIVMNSEGITESICLVSLYNVVCSFGKRYWTFAHFFSMRLAFI